MSHNYIPVQTWQQEELKLFLWFLLNIAVLHQNYEGTQLPVVFFPFRSLFFKIGYGFVCIRATLLNKRKPQLI